MKNKIDLMKQLYGENKNETRKQMSKCCKSEVDVLRGEVNDYYLCRFCHRPCELVIGENK